MAREKCLFCGEPIQITQENSALNIVNCPRCSTYKYTHHTSVALNNAEFSDREKATISGWLRENPNYLITNHNIRNLKAIKTPSFHERADKFLLFLEKKTKYAGDKISESEEWVSACWGLNRPETLEIINYLSASKYIEKGTSVSHVSIKIAPLGWARLEELKKVNADSSQGFVAMWFNDEMQNVYDNFISPAISEAGYKPHKVDQREHNDKIDDEIIAQIRRSRFIIADFTGQRGGVYYEAGFARGLGLEVIWTCRDDDIDNLHFDIRQYNCIVWNNNDLNDFSRRLTNRIESVLGHGPVSASD